MSGTFPPLWVCVLHIFAFMLSEDCLFYWMHRLLHHPALYKHIHKVCRG
jgi:sterol desaturase/sphingolipid hydroxylase (fatty acid hydroxylase superfamily)